MQIAVRWGQLQDALRHFELVRPGGLGMVRVVTDGAGTCRVEVCDSDRLITTTFQGAATSAGAVVAPAAPFHDFARACTPDQGTIEARDGKVHVVADGSRIALQCYDAGVWPDRRHSDTTASMWSARILSEIGRVLYAVGTDRARPALCGVQIKDGWAVATDTRRLAAAQVPAPTGTDLVIPGDVLRSVLRLAGDDGCLVRASGRQITFEIRSTLVTSSLIVEPFPEWRTAIPRNYAEEVRLDRAELLAALHRLSAMAARDRLGTLRMRPHGGHVLLDVSVTDVGSQDDTVQGTTTMPEIAFGLPYLVDLARACREDEVVLRSSGSLAPFIVEEQGYIAYLMPIRT